MSDDRRAPFRIGGPLPSAGDMASQLTVLTQEAGEPGPRRPGSVAAPVSQLTLAAAAAADGPTVVPFQGRQLLTSALRLPHAPRHRLGVRQPGWEPCHLCVHLPEG